MGGDDAFMLKLEDHSKNENYPSMTDGERVTASVDSGDLHYEGAAVVAVAASSSPAGTARPVTCACTRRIRRSRAHRFRTGIPC
jgi:hypothetical protein